MLSRLFNLNRSYFPCQNTTGNVSIFSISIIILHLLDYENAQEYSQLSEQ